MQRGRLREDAWERRTTLGAPLCFLPATMPITEPAAPSAWMAGIG
ncbi:MAG: hypothetical protein NZ699_03935 [Roseiflexus sp.]|nr:hypothetical protein [Roseiflexus sp.]MCS7288264.1 hypothetical protein [Roseiflexus sp.]